MTDALWRVDVDNSPRHCWQVVDGSYVQAQAPGPFDEKPACLNPGDHPKLAGQTEWLRFIRAMGKVLPKTANPFVEDYHGLLKLDGYYEHYYGKDLATVVVTIYHNTETRRGWIEVYDPGLVEPAKEAWTMVEEQYAAMVSA